MNSNHHSPNQIFIRCCYGYAVSGMAVLVIGAVLPSIIKEAGISFLEAGGLLSVMAIGNLLASFLFPVLVSSVGRKHAITVMTGFAPLCLIGLSILPPLPAMYGLMLIYGLVRGCVTIFNNAAVNDIFASGATGRLNILHCSFAIGAFLAPFLTAISMKLGFGWRAVIDLLAVLTSTSTLSYGTMDAAAFGETGKTVRKKETPDLSAVQQRLGPNFLRSSQFYCIALILFFYLGTENCINGWFVTYLQNTGVMSETYATTLVSFTWLVIMAGRMACAALSKKMDKSSIILMNATGSAFFFFLLITTTSLPVITIALLGFGFFLAGIYPTCIANAGPLIQGSTFGMALLTAISAAGGIITPQIVGGIADLIGIVGAICVLSINTFVVMVLAAINAKKFHS